MKRCSHPDCSWQPIAASTAGARTALLRHLVTEHGAEDDAVTVDWFERSPGETSDRRSHDHEQVFIVLEGDLRLHTEDESIELTTGDSLSIEAGQRYHSENHGERPCVGIRTAAPGFERAN
ncbi:cupin domain-containing protein [Halomicroarcula sp. GCM10025709]|uniref:cupin domain-containing protein n=1 Tax=Haloarcula TaxID=2237 RepID=UPI0024C22EC1|nr:cupin domain-containing protein [Halomicroarcula sp. YJ-61-S]